MGATAGAPPRTARAAGPGRLARPAPLRGQVPRRLAESGLVGAVSVGLAAWALGLGSADLELPLRYAPVDDAKFYLMLVKGILEHGSYLANPALGFPFGQHLADYPQGADNLNLLLIRGLGVFSANPAWVVNVFLLLTFALTGAAAHLALRAHSVSAPVSGAVAVLFALLPYHFFRGESHLMLSAYYSIPLSAHLFLRVLEGRPLFARRASRPESGALAWVSPRSLGTVALCAVIGSDNLYYAVFATVLLGGAAVGSLGRGRWRAALGALAALTLVVATLGANLAPTLLYRAQHGVNPRLERSAVVNQGSTEALSLRPANLLLPAPNDRIAPLARFGAAYDRTIAPGYCEGCYSSLGVVGSVGLLWLAACVLGTLIGGGVWYGARSAFGHAAAGVALAVAVATVGGASGLIELWLTPDIRGWSRISLSIAFFSLYALGLVLDSLARRLSHRRGGRLAATVGLGFLLALGAFEQTTPPDTRGYAAGYREYRSDAALVGAMQARLPPGAAIFQLPYVPFPEGYPATACCGPIPTFATKYEPLRGYLHSRTLNWSYGAVKGRAGDWPAELAGQPLSYVVPAVVAAGFAGLWVDPAGFPARQASAGLLALAGLLGESPLTSPDHDLWFFDLRPYAARLRTRLPARTLSVLRQWTLRPVRVGCARRGVGLFNPAAAPVLVQLAVHQVAGVYRRVLRLAPGATVLPVPGASTAGDRVLYATATAAGAADVARRAASAGAPASLRRAPSQAVTAGLTGPGCPA